MMTAQRKAEEVVRFSTHLAYNAFKKREKELLPGRPVKPEMKPFCALCFTRINRGYRIRDVVSDSFTNYDAFHSGSNTLCRACALSFKVPELRFRIMKGGGEGEEEGEGEGEGGGAVTVVSGFCISSGGYRALRRKEELADALLFNPPEPPFVICITSSPTKNRHLLFRSPVNYSRDAFFVQFDENSLFFDRLKMAGLFGCMKRLIEDGFRPWNIRTGFYGKDKKLEGKAERAEKELAAIRGDPIFDLLLFLLAGGGGGEKESEE